MGFWRRLWYFITFRFRKPLPSLPPPDPKTALSNLTATVFVRESNGSRTDIEHYLEQELISRGARVVLANQKAGLEIIRNGQFEQLAAGINVSFVGTLVVDKKCVISKGVRETTLEGWPIIRYRDVRAWEYQLCYRLIGSDGVIFISGTVEEWIEADTDASNLLRRLAKAAFVQLDQTDVWNNVVIV